MSERVERSLVGGPCGWSITPGSKKLVEKKDELRIRLGRSTDRPDAVSMAVYRRRGRQTATVGGGVVTLWHPTPIPNEFLPTCRTEHLGRILSAMPDAVTRLNSALEGRYAIERELGEGGMATVYLADDLKHSRKVALKVLRPDLAAVVGADRFLREIET